MDARRAANARDGRIIKGPLKIFDTTPALIGGLYAEKHGKASNTAAPFSSAFSAASSPPTKPSRSRS